MKLLLKFHRFRLFFTLFRVKKVVGVSSLVKNGTGHFLFFDVDSQEPKIIDLVHGYLKHHNLLPYHFKFSRHGFHIIVPRLFTIQDALRYLLNCPYCDLRWVLMGFKRGYWFLETSKPIFLPNMRYMEIDRCG